MPGTYPSTIAGAKLWNVRTTSPAPTAPSGAARQAKQPDQRSPTSYPSAAASSKASGA